MSSRFASCSFVSSLLISTSIAFVAVGCGKDQDAGTAIHQEESVAPAQTPDSSLQPQEPVIPFDYQEFESFNEAQRKARKAEVVCQDYEKCNPSVGMMSMVLKSTPKMKAGVSVCTAFLVNDRTIMTNSHCLPPDLSVAGANCKDRIWMHFPSTIGYGSAPVGCKQVIFASDISRTVNAHGVRVAKPDYAFLEIDWITMRPPLVISRAGLQDQADYKTVKVNPTGINSLGNIEGQIQEVQCKALPRSTLVRDEFRGDHNTNVAIGDCEIVQGNSGSPILDSSGAVRGIVYATFDRRGLLDSIRNDQTPLEDDDIRPLGLGSNLSCLDIPVEKVARPHEDCDELANRPNQHAFQAYKRYNNGLFEKALKKQKRSKESFLQWTLMPNVLGGVNEFSFHMIPVCIKNTEKFLSKYRAWFGSNYSTDETIEYDAPNFKVTMGVNRYFEAVPVLKPLGQEYSFRVNFNPAEYAKSAKSSPMKIWKYEGDFKADALPAYTFDLQSCDDYYSPNRK